MRHFPRFMDLAGRSVLVLGEALNRVGFQSERGRAVERIVEPMVPPIH